MLPPEDPATGLLLVSAVLLLAGVLAGLVRRSGVAFLPAILATPLLAASCVLALAREHDIVWAIPSGLETVGLAARLDPLAALFLLLTAATGFSCALWASSADAPGDVSRPPLHVSAFHALLLGQLVLVLADDVFGVLYGLEIATLSIAMLALPRVSRDESSQTRPTDAFRYLVLGHVGTALVATGLLVLARHAGTTALSGIVDSAPSLSADLRAVPFALLLVGVAGSLGLVPLGSMARRTETRSEPHAAVLAATSAASAGLYVLVRASLFWVGAPPHGAALLLTLGSLTLLATTVLLAVEAEPRELASLAGQAAVALAVVDLGAALSLASRADRPALAYALTATLYQLSAAVLLRAALGLGGAALERSGGARIGKIEPVTVDRAPSLTAFVVLGTLSAALLPPSSGFVGAWMSFQTLLLALDPARGARAELAALLALPALALLLPVSAAALLRIGGAAVSPARPPRIEGSRADLSLRMSLRALGSRSALLVPGLGAVGLGLFAGGAVSEIGRVAARVAHAEAPPSLWHPQALPLPPSPGAVEPGFLSLLSMPALVAALALTSLLTLGLLALARRPRAAPARTTRIALPVPGSSGPVFSASGLAQPFAHLLRSLVGTREEADLVEGDSVSPRHVRFEHGRTSPLARPLAALLRTLERIPELTFLEPRSPRAGLAWMLLAITLLLAVGAHR